MPDKITDTEEAWDSRRLGAEEAYAATAEMDESALDEALGLQPISIRPSARSLPERWRACTP